MPDRDELRHRVWERHRRWLTARREMGVDCPWCGLPILDGWHAHEYLVKRSSAPLHLQHLIMVPQNIVPLHPWCHTEHGQSTEMVTRCLPAAAAAMTAQAIGTWYVSLWQDHGLSVPHGLLIPPKELPIRAGRELFALGSEINSEPIPDPVVGNGGVEYDLRDMGFVLWTGRWKIYRHKVEWPQRPSKSRIVGTIEEGYWMKYLTDLCR